MYRVKGFNVLLGVGKDKTLSCGGLYTVYFFKPEVVLSNIIARNTLGRGAIVEET